MLCFRLSATLLLAATCLLFRAAFSNRSVTRVLTCDEPGHVHRLSCESGVLKVLAALYGRADSETCSAGKLQEQLSDTGCASRDALRIIKKHCNNKEMCELDTGLFSDPCDGTSKYLETTHICFETIRSVTCENSQSNLHCDDGQVVFVYKADFGRSDTTTCTYQRPHEQVQTTDCSLPTSKVSKSCNRKSDCMVEASVSIFGDPCLNTYKYLDVTYACVFHAVACENQTLELTCDAGQIIAVHCTVYGRTDATLCSAGVPPEFVQNTNCPMFPKSVAAICNGQNNCAVQVTHAMFEDPCPGTYKYLEVAYTCHE